MDRAREAWRTVDANLERDIFRMPQGKALERIDTADESARAFQEKQSAYYETFLARLRGAISSLSSAQGKFDAETFQGSVGRRLEALGDAERDLEQAASGLPDADTKHVLESSEAQVQLRKLRDLRTNLANQSEAMNQAAAKARSLEEARLGLAASYSALLNLITVNAGQSKSENSTWIKYYDSLRELVTKRATDAPPEGKKLKSEKRPQ
jgi:hypothetical protein